MVAKAGRSRKLLLLLFCSPTLFSNHDKLPFNYEATTSSATSSTSFVANETLWLRDEASGQCLGAHGHFGECGDQSLWVWNSLGGDVLLQSAHSWDPFSLNFDKAECIGRKRSLLKKDELQLLPCAHAPLSRTMWTFDEQSGRLADTSSLVAKARGPSCVINAPGTGPGGEARILQNCRKGYTSLKPVVFNFRTSTAPDPNTIASSHWGAGESGEVEEGEAEEGARFYKCPITGQVFPRNLDRQLGTSSEGQQGQQVFMGGGVFSRTFVGMDFHIYSMAFYIDTEAAQLDASLQAFRSTPLFELRQDEAFFEALAAKGDYDRTLFVKLAMTLKTQILLEGFLAEIYLLPKNKAIVAEASAQYTEPVCPQGLEILFSWRKGGGGVGGAGGVGGVGAVTDVLEVRIGKSLFTLEEAGLAEDFMRQFFSNQPVSPAAKMGFARGFPALLSAPSSSSFHAAAGAGPSLSTGVLPVPPTQPTRAPKAVAAPSAVDDSSVPVPVQEKKEKREKKEVQEEDKLARLCRFLGRKLRRGLKKGLKKGLRAAERAADMLNSHFHLDVFEPTAEGQRWLQHLHFVADQHAPSHGFYEYAASIFVLLYCVLLILLSMPPALLDTGVRNLRREVGKQRQCLREIKSTLRRSINSSCTLKNLAMASASTEISLC
jgi:hypothetical protein